MTEIYDNNGKTIIYKYNAQGLRTSKTVNGDTTSYLYEGSKVIQMTKNVGENQYVIYFVYDANGLLIGLNTAEGQYFYRRDITGNIIGIIDSNGIYVIEYRYDAWGNIRNTNFGVICIVSKHNPFLYKGYVYDEETKWYYLQSRYYIPEIDRFLSPDSIDYIDPTSIGGLNLYAYCGNDPINYYDPSGKFALAISGTTLLISALVALIAAALVTTVIVVEKETHIISTGIEMIIDECKDFVKKVEADIKDFADALVAKRDYGNMKEKHHIVPKRAKGASDARRILEETGIGVENELNKVYVKKGFHRVMHTKVYYAFINYSITKAYELGGTEGVILVLTALNVGISMTIGIN